MKTKKLKLGQRVHTTGTKRLNWKFEDGYRYPIDVPEDKWYTNTPNVDGEDFPEAIIKKYNLRSNTISGKDGKWVYKSEYEANGGLVLWGKMRGGVSTRVKNRHFVNYESPTSNRFLVRLAVHLEEIDGSDDSVIFSHATKQSSMYVTSYEG